MKALELLDEETVERAVLLAPALSPRYDLTAAFRAVRREMVVFWSPLDVIILGFGTRLFGTSRSGPDSRGRPGWFSDPRRRYSRPEIGTASTESFVKFAGTRGWRPPAISVDIWARIVHCFSRSTSCRSSSLTKPHSR